jgi:cobalt/nickel transport system permease protein
MHIPDGFLSPEVAGSTLVSSGLAWSWGTHRLRTLSVEEIPRLGLAGALLFTLEVIAFPIPGGTSVHLSGVPLIALWLGIPQAVFLSGVGLFLQALFGHGGILTWGANMLNIGILGSLIPAAFVRIHPGRISVFLGTMLAILTGALFTSVELSLSGTLALHPTLWIMLGATAPVAILEGLITATAVHFLSGP